MLLAIMILTLSETHKKFQENIIKRSSMTNEVVFVNRILIIRIQATAIHILTRRR